MKVRLEILLACLAVLALASCSTTKALYHACRDGLCR
jgi:hypothetical protein